MAACLLRHASGLHYPHERAVTTLRIALALTLLTITLGAAQAEVCLVRDGTPQAQIVVPGGCSEPVKAAAATLADYVRQASGAVLPMVEESALPEEVTGTLVLVGPTKRWPVTFPQGFDADGFIIAARGRAVSICGPSDFGTQFGVYDLLERSLGVRWLLPGDSGTDVPARRTIVIPEGRVQDQPAFFSRLFSGLRGAPQARWAQFNRMHGRVSFHHSLGENIFRPETYKATHPEFFPMKDGQTRYLPADKLYHGWQPCLTAPDSVRVAVETICAYFRANPAATSFSLGTNDSSGYCRCPACLARIAPEHKNFLGLTDYSDLYYDWCNRVIEGVLQQYPDKWFGCLAYSEVAAPPTRVKVHPRLIPYMTYDRMKWIEPELERAGHEATEAWGKASPTLGWYDYIYGTPYCLPRVFFHQSQRYLSYGRQHGVKAHYAEIYPNWAEGPKPYLFLKLWWNPDQDVDTLLAEWYERCVGKRAAGDLAKYYALWERFWTQDIRSSKWFSKGGQYLAFHSPLYLADVKREDLAESRRLLDRVLSECETPAQHARAALLEKGFQYYEASALAYLAGANLPPSLDRESDALEALSQAAAVMGMAEKRRRLALEEFPKDPVLLHPIPIADNGALRGEAWGGGGIWAVMDWVVKGDNAVRRRVAELAAGPAGPAADQARLMLDVADGRADLLSANPSFEDGSKPWSFWVKPEGGETGPPVGKMLLSEDVAHAGTRSVLCDGMYRGGPVQTIPFPGPGKYCALTWVYTPAGQEPGRGTVELCLTPRDDKGANLPGYSTKVIPTAGKWKLLVVGADIPAELAGKPVKSLMLVPIVDSFQAGKVYYDEVSLYRVK